MHKAIALVVPLLSPEDIALQGEYNHYHGESAGRLALIQKFHLY